MAASVLDLPVLAWHSAAEARWTPDRREARSALVAGAEDHDLRHMVCAEVVG